MNGGDGPVELVIGLLVGNVAYILFTVVIGAIYDVSVMQMATDTLAGTASQIISAWITVGVLLGLLDIIVIVGFIGQLASGGT